MLLIPDRKPLRSEGECLQIPAIVFLQESLLPHHHFEAT